MQIRFTVYKTTTKNNVDARNDNQRHTVIIIIIINNSMQQKQNRFVYKKTGPCVEPQIFFNIYMSENKLTDGDPQFLHE